MKEAVLCEPNAIQFELDLANEELGIPEYVAGHPPPEYGGRGSRVHRKVPETANLAAWPKAACALWR